MIQLKNIIERPMEIKGYTGYLLMDLGRGVA